MKYETFAHQVERHGLEPRECDRHHWQIRGGIVSPVVNVWANSRKGFRYQAGIGHARQGSIEKAIAAAGPAEARIEPLEKPEDVFTEEQLKEWAIENDFIEPSSE